VTRFSGRHATLIAIVLAFTLAAVAYGRLSPRRDECQSHATLLDATAIDPSIELITEGRPRTRIEAGRLVGTVPATRSSVPITVSIQRTYGLPNRLLAPASALPGRREPDDVQLETLTTEQGEIPVHYAYERRGRAVRLTAYLMAFRGTAVRSPLWTRITGGPAALVDGQWPITLFAASVRTHSRQLESNVERANDVLRRSWSHYLRVCASAASSASDNRPL
jgi:hypothetical protein